MAAAGRALAVGVAAALRSASPPAVTAARALPNVAGLRRLLGGGDGSAVSEREALAAGAKIYLSSMALSESTVKDDEDLRLAALRFLRLRQLQQLTAEQEEGGEAEPGLVPTRDISAVWAAQLLRPHGLERDGPELRQGTTWYEHQQHRHLQSGAQFERAEGGRNGDGKTGFFGYKCGLPGAVVGGVLGVALPIAANPMASVLLGAWSGANLPGYPFTLRNSHNAEDKDIVTLDGTRERLGRGTKVSTVALWWNGETPWHLGGWMGALAGTAMGCWFMYSPEFYSSKMPMLSRFDRASSRT